MNTPNLFVRDLSSEEQKKLNENYQSANSFRLRNRSHAILLSAQGFSIDDIARIRRTHRNSISRWINRWNKDGLASLEDLKRSGRPKILTDAEEDRIIEIAAKNPRFPQRKISEITEATGKKISVHTLKGLIKRKSEYFRKLAELSGEKVSAGETGSQK